MNKYQRSYYHKMKQRNRLIPVRDNNILRAIITFFIGNENDTDKFVRDKMWDTVPDDSDGNTVFIDHLVTKKFKDNPYHSIAVWTYLKRYFRDKFPNVRYIRWNRFKNKKVKVYQKEVH